MRKLKLNSVLISSDELMAKCPGLESNQHDPKVTSPSSYNPSPTNDSKDSDLENPQNAGMPKSMPCAHENDTDLAHLIESWPTLPDHIKQAIMALIQTAERS